MVDKLKLLFFAVILTSCCISAKSQIVINSRFKPFTYDEMVAPLQAVAQFHQQCCDALIGLLENAEQIESCISKDSDPITWKRYADYYNSIVDEYNSINKNGTNRSTRNRINQLKREYSTVINGIRNAYNRRADLANNQYQRVQYSHEKCSRWYSEISLDEFLDGNTPNVTYTN